MNKITITKSNQVYRVDGQTYTDLSLAWSAAVALAGDGGEVAAAANFTVEEFATLRTLHHLVNGQDAEPVSWRFAHPGFPMQDAIYESRARRGWGSR
jgi:hypothetical protein